MNTVTKTIIFGCLFAWSGICFLFVQINPVFASTSDPTTLNQPSAGTGVNFQSDGYSDIVAVLLSQFQGIQVQNGHYLNPDCGDLQPEIAPVDLNGDGIDEYFLRWGNTCTSGQAGRSLSLFIRNSDGHYADHFGFPAFSYKILARQESPYPDIEIGGPGFCFPVWRWDGVAYRFLCNRAQSPDGCAMLQSTCSQVMSHIE